MAPPPGITIPSPWQWPGAAWPGRDRSIAFALSQRRSPRSRSPAQALAAQPSEVPIVGRTAPPAATHLRRDRPSGSRWTRDAPIRSPRSAHGDGRHSRPPRMPCSMKEAGNPSTVICRRETRQGAGGLRQPTPNSPPTNQWVGAASGAPARGRPSAAPNQRRSSDHAPVQGGGRDERQSLGVKIEHAAPCLAPTITNTTVVDHLLPG